MSLTGHPTELPHHVPVARPRRHLSRRIAAADDGRDAGIPFTQRQSYHSFVECSRALLRAMEDSRFLRNSELRYRRLFEAARDGILILNAETGGIEDANPFMSELLGYTHDLSLIHI